MAVALFYNAADAAVIAAQVTRTDLAAADRGFAQQVWQGGLRAWRSAPVAPAPYNDGSPDNPTLLFVITGVTKADLVAWLRRVQGFDTFADDVTLTAVEPWPSP